MKKTILSFRKILSENQLKEISGGRMGDEDWFYPECNHHDHVYDYNQKRWLCLPPN